MVNTDDCWLYAGTINDKGYARLRRYLSGKHYNFAVHRLTYEQFKGAIPEGLEIDHLCRVRCCVNPDHLEAVTHKVNNARGYSWSAVNARKTHCPKGHEYTEENILRKRGFRYCRSCEKERSRKWLKYNGYV